jgi:hypothetical protein
LLVSILINHSFHSYLLLFIRTLIHHIVVLDCCGHGPLFSPFHFHRIDDVDEPADDEGHVNHYLSHLEADIEEDEAMDELLNVNSAAGDNDDPQPDLLSSDGDDRRGPPPPGICKHKAVFSTPSFYPGTGVLLLGSLHFFSPS